MWKECSDGAGNRRNRKISSRRFSSLVPFFFSTQKIRDARAPQSRTFREKSSLWNTKINGILHFLFIVEVQPIAGCPHCARLCDEMGTICDVNKEELYVWRCPSRSISVHNHVARLPAALISMNRKCRISLILVFRRGNFSRNARLCGALASRIL